MHSDIDTDTALAILSSLLEPATFPIEDLLDALTAFGGDTAKAAEHLLLPRVRSAGKRKAGTSLESWLSKKRDATSPTPTLAPSLRSRTENKPTVDLLSVLKQPESSKPKNAPQSAILVSTQQGIDKHGLPLTILESPLSPEFSSALYLAMMEESEHWEKNKWYLAGRWVESPHLMITYAQPGEGYGDEQDMSKYYYTGSEMDKAKPYPRLLRLAAEMIEPVVNASLAKRARYPLEYAGPWRANMCGANRYDGSASGVGWHADQLTYLGPGATIASLSLGTPRAFRLRETNSVDSSYGSGNAIRTYEINLGHNSLILMNAGCQERFKHTVPSQKALDLFRPGWDIDQAPIPKEQRKAYTARINITFRFCRPDFHPLPKPGPDPREGTPICKCGIQTVLRADQKAKARSKLPPSPSKGKIKDGVVDDDMIYFWQCQSPGVTGEMKGCGFFRILDMRAEGRGPCIWDV